MADADWPAVPADGLAGKLAVAGGPARAGDADGVLDPVEMTLMAAAEPPATTSTTIAAVAAIPPPDLIRTAPG